MTLQPMDPLEMARALRRGIAECSERARMRRTLGRMSDRLLADVGLSPEAVAHEVEAPFWRPIGPELAALVDLNPPRPAVRAPALPLGFATVARLAAAVFPNRA